MIRTYSRRHSSCCDKLPTWKPLGNKLEPLEKNNSEDTFTTEAFPGSGHADVNTVAIHSDGEFEFDLT